MVKVAIKEKFGGPGKSMMFIGRRNAVLRPGVQKQSRRRRRARSGRVPRRRRR